MDQLAIPKIVLNDDSESVKSGRSNSSTESHHILKSTKSHSESLFSYSANSSNTSIDKLEETVEKEERKTIDVDDPHVPIPDYFVHSTVISEGDFRQFVRLKKIDLNTNRFGEVFRYVDTRTMIPMVGNVVKFEVFDSWSNNPPQQEKKISEFIEDAKRIATLRHQRIAHLYGIYKNRDKMIVFNEYVPRGSVWDKLNKSAIDETTAVKYFRQAVEGLRYIHSRNITHGNIRASNLLITFSDDIKITDFTFAYDLTTNNFGEHPGHISNYRIKLLYAAPETIQKSSDELYPSEDIWALGCVLVTMLTRAPPYYKIFKEKTDQEVYKIITDNYSKPVDQRLSYSSGSLIPQASEELKTLLDFVMNDDQSSRPTAEEILENQVLKKNFLECRQIPLFSFQKPLEKITEKTLYNGGILEREREKDQLMQSDQSHFRARETTINPTLDTCELNEGFVVLIAIIFLPIIILLTTLCCNNACEKYRVSIQSEKVKKSRFYVPEPADDVVLCGIKVIHGEARKHKMSTAKRKRGSSDIEYSNLSHTGMLKTIEDLA